MQVKLNRLVLVILVLLLIQFVSGIGTAWDVKIPAHTTSLGWTLAHSGFFLRLHAFVGFMLGVGSVLAVLASIRVRRAGWVTWSVLGCVFTWISGINGVLYVSPGGRQLHSTLMTLAFFAAFVCYGVALLAEWSRNHAKQ